MEQQTYRIQYTYTGNTIDPENTVTIGPTTASSSRPWTP